MKKKRTRVVADSPSPKLRQHARKQAARNAAAYEAIALIKQALTRMRKAGFETLRFYEDRKREVVLSVRTLKPRYEAPPRAKVLEGAVPDILLRSKWREMIVGEGDLYGPPPLRFPCATGGHWRIVLSYTMHLYREGANNKLTRIGGNFRSFDRAARRAYDTEQHELGKKRK